MERDVYKVIDYDLEDFIFELDQMRIESPVPIYPGDMLIYTYILHLFLIKIEIYYLHDISRISSI